MIPVAKALSIVEQNSIQLHATEVLLEKSMGCVLAQNVLADRDLPPYNRITMDGVALSSERFEQDEQEFIIEAQTRAGEPVYQLQNLSCCVEVTTGAVLPLGTDCVVRYEDIERDGLRVKVRREYVRSGRFIHSRASDAKASDVLLHENSIISAAEVSLMASVGMRNVRVYRFPKTILVSTGDELVDIDNVPAPHQIRQSNVYGLQSAMLALGWHANHIHLKDDYGSLVEQLQQLITDYDVVILSGGVSKGKYDFLPAALQAIGVSIIFHEVSQRPGKPFLFAKGDKTVVFALPGNPVSTFLCFYRYIKPWIQRCLGIPDAQQYAMLAESIEFLPALTYFLQVKVRHEGAILMAYPRAGGGSGDFVNLKNVDGFLELPAGQSHFKAGDVFPFIPFRH